MRRLFAPIALACAVVTALPAAAQSVSVSARSRGGPDVEVYIEAQSRGVPAAVLYDHARSEHRLVARRDLPPIGTFAYFGVQGATVAAVVTDVHIDGTVTLLHHDAYGRATALQMNLRYPNHHRRYGRVVNDYVSFAGPPALAPASFYGYAQPPPRVIVVNAPRHHGGHGGYVGPREHREYDSCLPAGHPGKGHAYGRCKNGRHGHGHGHGHHDSYARYDDDYDHDDCDDDKHKHKKKNKKGKKQKGKKGHGSRGDNHDDREHKARKKYEV